MKTEKITFPGSQGNLLAARLDSPAEDIKGYALFVHCFTCSKETLAASHIASALVERGIAVLRFDFTGLGGSGGEFSNTNFSSNIEDIKLAIDYMKYEGKTPEILIGHSLGGSAVLRAAESSPDLKAIVTINAPSDPTHLRYVLKEALPEISNEGHASVVLGGREFLIQKQFIDDLEKNKSLEFLKDIHAALLIFHSPQDAIVNIDNARDIYMAAHHPKSFISLYEADHLLTQSVDAIYVANIISSWVDRYMLIQELKESEDTNQVTVTETGEGKFTQLVQIGNHSFIADEPLNVGGMDRGPGPYDLILAGLGACTSMTLRLYATQNNIPVKGIQVTLTHEKVYNEDQIDCVDKNERLDLIQRVITLKGDLSKEQIADLLRVADKCPVHKTLTQPSIIKTTLDVEEG